jgi:protein-S-isoprenylcysteine O-methyltransferase Ste14
MSAAQGAIIAALWIAWLAVWAIAARSAKLAERQESAGSRMSYLALLIVAGVLLGAPFTSAGWLGARFFPTGWAPFAIGAAVLALGLGFAVWARVHLGGNWSSGVEIKRGHALIVGGPYRLARHPIYTGLLAAFLGTALARGEWHGLLAVPIAAAALWRKAQLEERWLCETFGADYAAYQAKVAALIPFVL